MTGDPIVIITRPEPDATDFARSVAAAGLVAVRSPAMRIVMTPGDPDLGGVAALAFTSANGVRAFAAAGGGPGLKVFAVGPATAAAARAAGHQDTAVAGGDVDALAQLIINERKALPEGDILHIAGAARRGDLVSALQAHGVKARRATLYEAAANKTLSAAAQSALRNDGASGRIAFVFFSPRTVGLVKAQADAAGLGDAATAAAAVCLSEAVASEARRHGWTKINVAAEPSAASILSMLKARDKL